MKCFYHSANLDGHCSGAIVKRAHPECELIGINYGDPFPWDSIEPGETVYMVDFCLQPFDDMVKLNGICDLYWFDHHKSAIKEEAKQDVDIAGFRSEKLAGCEICWDQFFPTKPMPTGVYLLGRYDVWNLDAHPHVMPFQWGMRLNAETRPEHDMEVWERVFAGDVDGTVQVGTVCLAYQTAQNTKYAKSSAFESELDGYPIIVINKGLANSQLFDAVWDPEEYWMMVTFVWRKGQWHISLYSTREDVDCSVIAKERGGGGHKGAAGFQCAILPFSLK